MGKNSCEATELKPSNLFFTIGITALYDMAISILGTTTSIS